MNKNENFCYFFAFIVTAFTAVSQTFTAPDLNFHIYLAFDQSNMVLVQL